MNFFGHAAVASWTSDAPGLAFGAMIPDFSTMSGARLDSTPDPDVTAGIALHHATDAAFHTLPAVTGLMRELDAILARLGCARGPRRAVAHIGVELLLDGVLVDEPAYRAAYTRALTHEAPMIWRDPADAPRFTLLIDRLRAHGVPDDLKRTDAITARLARVLQHRPLLKPSAADLVAIRQALDDFQQRVVVATATILRALKIGTGLS